MEVGGPDPLKSWPSVEFYLVENGPDYSFFGLLGVGGDHPTPRKKWPRFGFHGADFGRFLADFGPILAIIWPFFDESGHHGGRGRGTPW